MIDSPYLRLAILSSILAVLYMTIHTESVARKWITFVHAEMRVLTLVEEESEV